MREYIKFSKLKKLQKDLVLTREAMTFCATKVLYKVNTDAKMVISNSFITLIQPLKLS